jgi:GT2 family glycosyltransferase
MRVCQLSMSEPAVTVAIASLSRPVRLRWLLNALSEQTAAPDSFEIVVAHAGSSQETAQLVREHPLAVSGRLRTTRFPPASTNPGAGRNSAWRAARGRLVLFTDDDCRPDEHWVQQALDGAAEHPEMVLQGRTLPDPDEAAVLRGAPWARTMLIEPPTPWAETCNVAYPRRVLERIDGFREDLRVGEDAELASRARAAGVAFTPQPRMLVYHAVMARSLPRAVLEAARWRDLASLVKLHPELRRHMWGHVWWKREHAALMAALVGIGASRRELSLSILALPWIVLAMQHRGYSARGLARSASELPGRVALDAAEIVAMLRGSVRYRTMLL